MAVTPLIPRSPTSDLQLRSIPILQVDTLSTFTISLSASSHWRPSAPPAGTPLAACRLAHSHPILSKCKSLLRTLLWQRPVQRTQCPGRLRASTTNHDGPAAGSWTFMVSVSPELSSPRSPVTSHHTCAFTSLHSANVDPSSRNVRP